MATGATSGTRGINHLVRELGSTASVPPETMRAFERNVEAAAGTVLKQATISQNLAEAVQMAHNQEDGRQET